MIIKEKYIKSAKLNNLSGPLIFFSNNKSEIKNMDKLLSSSSNNLFKKNLKNNNKKKEIFSFDISHTQKIIIFSLKNNENSYEKIGAKLYEFCKSQFLNKVSIFGDTIENSNVTKCLHELVHGMRLKSYSFDRYKSKKDSKILKVNMISSKKFNKKIYDKIKAIEIGVNYTKDLV